MAFLEIRDLSFTYNGAGEKALDGITLDIEKGDFVLLCGKSGCGKSTLLRMIKRQLSPVGKTEGEIIFDGKALSSLEEKESVCRIGMVMQDPDSQIVTEKVWHEIAFGLENVGENVGAVRRKTAEICGFLGIADLFEKDTSELSGGEKQLVCLASVLAMNPDVLLLDEPSGQLDPISAEKLITMLYKLSGENGLTVILAEHRTENVFPLCDKVIFIDKGKTVLNAAPEKLASDQNGKAGEISGFFPPALRLFMLTGGKDGCPLNVRDGKRYVENTFSPVPALPRSHPEPAKTVISAENLVFRYSREGSDVIKDVSLSVSEKEFFCILGENGSGKTTLLKLLAALKAPLYGKVKYKGKNTAKMKGNELYRGAVSYLPQNPKYVFTGSELYKDLENSAKREGVSEEEAKKKIALISEKLGISSLLSAHPYDLSGGEAQKAALAKLLLSEPSVLLLDEPTKGLDPYAKKEIGELLSGLKNDGLTIIAVTHDTGFASEYADRCALLFNGSLMNVTDTVTFFSENNYYTTAFSKMTRGICPNCITESDVSQACVSKK